MLSEYEKKRKRNRDFFDSLLNDDDDDNDARRDSGIVMIHAVALVIVSARGGSVWGCLPCLQRNQMGQSCCTIESRRSQGFFLFITHVL